MKRPCPSYALFEGHHHDPPSQAQQVQQAHWRAGDGERSDAPRSGCAPPLEPQEILALRVATSLETGRRYVSIAGLSHAGIPTLNQLRPACPDGIRRETVADGWV